jgi:hypothetical protein
MNKNIFNAINSEKKAYWLGFLYADGCNIPDYNKVIIELSVKDLKHLKKFCNFIGISSYKIKILPPSEKVCKGKIIHGNGSCTIVVYSKQVANSLVKLGMIKAKSLILKFPNKKIVPNKYIRHFIRGYFDGDGCLSKYYSNHATRYNFTIISTHNFCKSMRNVVKSIANLKLWNTQGKMQYCNISGNRQVKKFLDWIYKGSSVFLDRKYKIYKELKKTLNKIDRKPSYSRYNNITFDKSRNKWMACIRINKKTRHIGRFNTEKEALKAQTSFIKGIKYI